MFLQIHYNASLYAFLKKEVMPGIAENSVALLPAATSVVTLAVAIPVIIGLYRRPPNFRRYDPDEYGDRFRGFKGLLVPLAIVVLAQPILNILVAIGDGFIYESGIHRALTVPGGSPWFSPWWEPALFFSASAHLLAVVLSFAAAMALLTRRRSFRMLFLLYLLFVALRAGMHDFFLTQIFPYGHEVLLESVQHVSRGFSLVVVLGPYLFLSRRVQATFRN